MTQIPTLPLPMNTDPPGSPPGRLRNRSACVGDCDGPGSVTVNELITMVNIALGNTDASHCTAGDANQDGTIAINELIAAVNSSLNGC